MWEITGKPIDYAKEIGNIVVHFNRNNVPVLIEILEASNFLAKVKDVVSKENKIAIRKLTLATR